MHTFNMILDNIGQIKTKTSKNSITLAWKEPSAGITDYVVKWKIMSYSGCNRKHVTTCNVTIGNLQAEQKYMFLITARDSSRRAKKSVWWVQ